MSTDAPGRYMDTGGRGWIAFAGWMLLLIGAANCIGGIAAASGSEFFAGAAPYITGDLESIGWIVLALGVGQLIAGFGIWSRSFPAVWFGVATSGLNALGHLFFMPARPLWSLSILTIDVLVMYALITYGDVDY
jgi:hypothetical protein